MELPEPDGLSIQIDTILDQLEPSSAAAGVARQIVADDSLDRLTPAQRKLYTSQILPLLISRSEFEASLEAKRQMERIKD